MGKSSAKQIVDDYSMSIHLGICWGPIDAITGLFVGEKIAWVGNVSTEAAIYVNAPSLFGGPKSEGGIGGVMYYLPGGRDQVMPESLASRYGMSSASSPGYRGVASVFFIGSEGIDPGSLDVSGGGNPNVTPGGGGDGSAGGETGGGGGSGCVWVEAVLPDGRSTDEVAVGDRLRVLDGEADVRGVKRLVRSPCVTLVSMSGIECTVSQSTPFTCQSGRVISVMDCLGVLAPVEDEDGFRWEAIVAIREAGRRDVMKIDLGGETFAAGDAPGRFIYTHNKLVGPEVQQ